MKNFFIALGQVTIYTDDERVGEILTTTLATQQEMTIDYFDCTLTSITSDKNDKIIISHFRNFLKIKIIKH
jgi:hypothetical protein